MRATPRQETYAPRASAAPRSAISNALVRIPFVAYLVLVAFLLRIVAALFLHRVVLASGSFFTRGDEELYDYTAWQLAQVWSGQIPAIDSSYIYLVNAYTYLGGVVYLIVGRQVGAIIALNCLFAALTAGVIYLATRRLFGEVAARFAGIATAFFPSLFFWSLFNMKDALYSLFLALLCWALIALLQTGQRRWVLPIFLAVVVLGSLRVYVPGLLAVLLVGVVAIQPRIALPRKWQLAALLLITCGSLYFLGGSSQWMAGALPSFAHIRYQTAGDAGSAYVTPSPAPTGSDETTARRGALREIVHWLPTGLSYALAAPFPWAIQRKVDLTTLPEVFCWYGALALAVLGVVVQRRVWYRFIFIIAYVAALLLVLAIAESTVGTLIRHRMMVIPPLLILSGAGAGWLWARWSGNAVATKTAG